MMRIVSMVPSWTETLVACGANVVGRTRFCLHPAEEMKSIPVVGGTKDVDWKKVADLKPDLLLLDREENPKSMAESAICRFHATHVTSVEDLAGALGELANLYTDGLIDEQNNAPSQAVARELKRLAERWRVVALAPAARPSWTKLPGLLNWVRGPMKAPEDSRIVYVIWKNPWMAAAPGTFIASVLTRLGWKTEQVWPGVWGEKYPAFELAELDTESDVLLCSSEPFPFHKKRKELEALQRACALVNGENFSWFGLRSLVFLEKELSCGISAKF